MAIWKLTQTLKDKITHFASFPQVSIISCSPDDPTQEINQEDDMP